MGLITRRSEVQILPPPPKKVQVRAGLRDRPFCCPQVVSHVPLHGAAEGMPYAGVLFKVLGGPGELPGLGHDRHPCPRSTRPATMAATSARTREWRGQRRRGSSRPRRSGPAPRRRSSNPRRRSYRMCQPLAERLLGGTEVGPVYFLIGPEPGFVTTTGLTATPPIQLPVGVTAGGAELESLRTSSPKNP